MSFDERRIPPTIVTGNPAHKRTDIPKCPYLFNSLKNTPPAQPSLLLSPPQLSRQKIRPLFDTKEEFIKYLIETHQIVYQKSYKKDGTIHLLGNLIIDKRVKSGLDWSDVEATSASVEEGLITKYRYLPRTQKGVKTSLTTTSLDEYVTHNACKMQKRGDKYVYNGTFRIPNASKLPDFSRLTAKKVFCYYKGKIDLEHLPYTEEGIFGLQAENIITQGGDICKTAKAKGLGKNICRELKKREPGFLQKFLVSFSPKQSA